MEDADRYGVSYSGGNFHLDYAFSHKFKRLITKKTLQSTMLVVRLKQAGVKLCPGIQGVQKVTEHLLLN